jgi:hypothetical protein
VEQGSATQSSGRAPGGARDAFAFFPASWLRRLGWRGGDLGAALRETLERELGERVGFQWLAVAFGVGAVAYFALPREPAALALLASALLFAVIGGMSYRDGTPLRIAAIIAVVFAGAAVAKLRVDRLDAPHVERPLRRR